MSDLSFSLKTICAREHRKRLNRNWAFGRKVVSKKRIGIFSILIWLQIKTPNNELYFDYLELNGKFSGVNNSNKLYLTENKNSIKIPLFLDTQESNIVFSEKEKIEVPITILHQDKW
jgi:hypothetical protein